MYNTDIEGLLSPFHFAGSDFPLNSGDLAQFTPSSLSLVHNWSHQSPGPLTAAVHASGIQGNV